jgi:PAS/PAC sensor signal transduction histidine kinase (EC 2.7.13.3)
VEDPNLTIGSDGRIRGFGGGLEEIVPAFGKEAPEEEALGKEALGEPLAEVLPGLAETIEEGQSVWRASFDEGEEKSCRGSRDEAAPRPRESSQPEADCQYFQVVQAGLSRVGKTQTVILSDITERKRRTEQLKEAKKQAELSKLEAEEASRMKSAMLANMSHEIRTPLTGVIGFAEAIGEETGEEGSIARFARLIEDSGQRLLDTLDAVLNLSKLEAGQMALEAEPVDLADQAEQVGKELKAEAEESRLQLEMDLQEARVRADEGGLKIVLQNLLSNAIKYTEEGSVTIRTYQEEIDQEEKSEETDMVAVLEVEDTGIGMDPEVAERLFEPFRQASEGMSREYEGTGIGLAVTKKATEEMGGTIDVETEKGEGSRFTVRFPASGRVASQEEKRKQAA